MTQHCVVGSQPSYTALAPQRGFGLIEIAIAMAVAAVGLYSIVSIGTGSVVKNDMSAIEATTELNQDLVSVQNLISSISAMQQSTVNAALPTTAGSVVRIPSSGTTLYNSNGVNIYWYAQIRQMDYRTSASGGLIDRDGATVGAGSAVRVVPEGNHLYYATLIASKNADGSSPFATHGFYMQSTSCTGGVCPTYAANTTYLISNACRYIVDVTGSGACSSGVVSGGGGGGGGAVLGGGGGGGGGAVLGGGGGGGGSEVSGGGGGK